MSKVVVMSPDALRRLIVEAVEDGVSKATAAKLAATQMAGQVVNGDWRLIRVSKAAAMADVSEETVRRWLRQGRLTRHETGHGLRVDPDELRALLDCRRTPEATESDGRNAKQLAVEILSRPSRGGRR